MGTISSKKIYQLSELFEAKSNYLMLIRNVETGKDMKVKLGTLLTGKIIPTWDPEEEYNTGDNVDWNLKIWKSLTDNNIGNIPSEGANWTEVSASEVISTLPDNLQRVVPKAAHGFSVKNVITLDSSGAHVKVSSPATERFVGLVTEVVDTNSFRLHMSGYVTGLSGLTAGAIHYAQSDGTLSTTFSGMPVLIADTTTSGYIIARPFNQVEALSIVSGPPDTLTVNCAGQDSKIIRYSATDDHNFALTNSGNLSVLHVHARLSNTVTIQFDSTVVSQIEQTLGVIWDDANHQLTIQADTDEDWELSITRVNFGSGNIFKLKVAGPFV